MVGETAGQGGRAARSCNNNVHRACRVGRGSGRETRGAEDIDARRGDAADGPRPVGEAVLEVEPGERGAGRRDGVEEAVRPHPPGGVRDDAADDRVAVPEVAADAADGASRKAKKDDTEETDALEDDDVDVDLDDDDVLEDEDEDDKVSLDDIADVAIDDD